MNLLADLLAGHDRWTGAACIGDWSTFDPRRDDEDRDEYTARVRAAQDICHDCPIRTDCHATAQNMRPRDRAGIWAGTAYDHHGRPSKGMK